MSKRLAALLTPHRTSLKATWDRQLRLAGPPNTALAIPDILVHRMSDTLDQFSLLLRRAAAKRWPDLPPPEWEHLRDHCRCGLNPLLDYFATGGKALHLVLTDLSPEDRNALDQAWYFLAQQEVGSLCAVCCRSCAPAHAHPHAAESAVPVTPS